jgi:tetratricopeptide (TPR) repeat protein
MTAAARSREIETWAWLDPMGANARDAYAQDLLERGRRAEAMAQISQSTYVVPASNEHPYTNPRILPWLGDDQKRAIEGGLKRAVAANLAGGTAALSEYYATLGRNADRAKLLAGAAAKEPDPERRAEYLREAGGAYLAVGEPRKAEDLFRGAIEADPSNAQNYEGLIAGVLVPHEEFEQASALVEQGSASGADECRLALSIATGAERGGRREIAEQALNHALENDADSYDCTLALGRLYYGDKRYARAMVLLDTATRLKPDSADAYLELATAAEAAYDYDAAAKAYERAAVLAPRNEVVAQSVAAFKRKLADAAESEPAK